MKKQYRQPRVWLLCKNAYARYYRKVLIHLVQTNKQSSWKNQSIEKIIDLSHGGKRPYGS